MNARDILEISKVVPVVDIADRSDALYLAKALINAGIKIIEITLRNEMSISIIEALSGQDIVVGAGTVLNPYMLQECVDAGAAFAVSPGISIDLINAARDLDIPFIPGVSCASDIILALAHDMNNLKLFPAEAIGGRKLLKAFYGPFRNVRFLPTGGIDESNAAGYLELPNVACVGSSKIAPEDKVRENKWDEIEQSARSFIRSLG